MNSTVNVEKSYQAHTKAASSRKYVTDFKPLKSVQSL